MTPLDVQISFSPEAAALLRAAPAWPVTLMREVAIALDLENELTVGHIQAQRMSRRSEETLGVVTNRARLSLRPTKARIDGESVTSAIGSNVVYMGPHEFGFQGLVTVRAHMRRVFGAGRGEKVTLTRSRFSMGADGRIVERVTKKKRTVSGTVHVREHKREMNMPERAPIRRGIADRATNYRDALTRAALKAFSPSAS